MTMITVALILLVAGGMNVMCFWLGAKVGQMVSRGETIESPVVSPMEAVRERRDKKEAQRSQDRMDTILRNIEAYDGTTRGQEDVPGR